MPVQTEWLFRLHDPPASARAAARLVRTDRLRTQKMQVLRAVREHPGLTTRQLADVTGLDRYDVARRMKSLVADGRVERTAGEDGLLCWPAEE